MTISAAQFALFLLSDAPKLVLGEAKFAYETGGNVAEGTLYFGSRPYVTKSTETPASQSYRGVIRDIKFSRSLDADSQGGKSSFSVSDLVLDNEDGALDFLKDKIVDGRTVSFYLGSPTWVRADFTLVLVATMERVSAPSMGKIAIKLRDKRLLLDREIKGDAIGGSGPNATKYLPLIYGDCYNLDLSSQLYDSATLDYAVLSNWGATQSFVTDVRDNGVSLRSPSATWTSANTTANAGTDVITHVAHGFAVNDVIWSRTSGFVADGVATNIRARMFAGFPIAGDQVWVKSVPSADTFTCSLTKGGALLDITGTTFNPDGASGDLAVTRQRYYDNTRTNGRIFLSSTPAGRVTADVYNVSDSSGSVDTTAPFAMLRKLWLAYGNVLTAEIDATAIAAADVALDAKVSIGYFSINIFDRQNVIQVTDEVMESVFGWYGDNGLGVITCGLLDIGGLASATATRALTEDEILGDLTFENLAPTVSRANVNYQRNATVQADGLSTLLTQDQRTRWGSPYGKVQRSTAPSGTTYALNKPLYHKTMVEAEPRFLNVDDSSQGSSTTTPITSFSDEIVDDRKPNLTVFRGRCGIDKYDWGLGDVVTLTHSRFGLSAGKKCRVIGVSADLIAETVDLELLTYIAPDSTTASHP